MSMNGGGRIRESLVQLVDAFVQNCEQREFNSRIQKDREVDFIEYSEIRTLNTELYRLQEKEEQSIEVNEVISPVFPILDSVIQLGNKISDVESRHDIEVLQSSVEASLVFLNVFLCLSPHSDRSFMSEDVIQGTVTLLKTISSAYITPYIQGELEKAVMNVNLLNRTTELFDRFSIILARMKLTDTLLLQLMTTSLALAFLDPPSHDSSGAVAALSNGVTKCLIQIFRLYPRLRSVILQDLFASIIKQTDELKHVKHVRRHHKNNTVTIHNSTRIFLLLVQSCAGIPKMKSVDTIDLKSLLGQRNSSYAEIVSVCKTMLGHFINKCIKKGGEDDYRSLLTRLANDLLSALGTPEYPSTVLVLKMLCSMLVKIINARLGTDKSSSIDTATVLFAMNTVGSICSGLKSVLRENKEQPIMVVDAAPKDYDPEGRPGLMGEEFACVCGVNGPIEGQFMLDCDHCHKWFHGGCLGLSDVESTPDFWTCDDCIVADALKRQSHSLDKSAVVDAAGYKLLLPNGVAQLGRDIDSITPSKAKSVSLTSGGEITATKESSEKVYKQLVLNFLSHYSSGNALDIGSARQFLLTEWIHFSGEKVETTKGGESDLSEPEVEGDFERDEVKVWGYQWYLPKEVFLEDGERIPVLTRDGTTTLFKKLVADDILEKNVSFWLSSVMSALGQGQSTFRAKAIKALGEVIDADSSLVEDTRLTGAIRARFLDEAISVREAAIEFAGRIIQHSSSSPSSLPYLDMIIERIRDKGFSVRRRVVTILRNVLVENPQHPYRVKISVALLQRVTDAMEEEDIIKMVLDSFHTIWFDTKDEETGDEDILSRRRSGATASSLFSKRIEHIVDVVAAVDDTEWLVTLLRRLLQPSIVKDPETRKTDDDEELIETKPVLNKKEDKQLKAATKICSILTKSAVDELIHLISDDEGPDRSRRIVALMTLLKIFSSSHPPLMQPHVHVFDTLIKGGNGLEVEDEVHVVNCALVCITNALFSAKTLPTKLTEQLESNLVRLIYNFPSPLVTMSAVECLATLILQISHNDGVIRKVLKSFYDYLVKRYDVSADVINSQNLSNSKRALFIMGYLCRWYDFDDPKILKEHGFEMNAAFEPLTSGETINHVYELYLKYADPSTSYDELLKCKAIQGFGFLLCRKPSLILNAVAERIFTSALSSSSIQLRQQGLVAFLELLQSEDRRVSSQDAAMQLSRRATKHAQVMGDQDTEAAVFGSIVQSNLSLILALAFEEDSSMRKHLTLLIELILRQGLVNPAQCIPTIFALMSDSVEEIRELSYKSIFMIKEKWPHFLYQKIIEGFRLSHQFRKAICRTSIPSPLLLYDADGNMKQHNLDCFFSSFYSIAIRDNLDIRKRFFRDMINEFDFTLDADDKERTEIKRRDRLSFLRYLCEILSSLPYVNQEEPLHIIYLINRLVSHRGDNLLEGMHYAATALTDSEADPNISEVNRFRAQCEQGYALGLLLNVKHYLKSSYGLSDTKCVSYTPSVTKANEKNATRVDEMSPIKLPPLPYTPEKMKSAMRTEAGAIAFALGVLVPTYETFKLLMKEDPADFSLATPGAKKGSKKRKRSATLEEEEGMEGDSDVEVKSSAKVRKTKSVSKTPKSSAKKGKRGRKKMVVEDDLDEDDSDYDA